MILPDVNILMHAFRPDAGEHLRCRQWLSEVVNGESRYGLSTQVLSSVIRPDAWLAALAIEWGCEWITLDRDYSRFPGLRWRLPY